MPELFKILLLMMLSFSVAGSVLVLLDKYNAVHRLYRVSEETLYIFGACGGALLMFFCMKLCHHKTRKKGFMLGFPLMAAVHIVLLFLCYR